MPPIQYRSQVMDHLGLVAGICKELGIAEHIDKRIPKVSDDWHIWFCFVVLPLANHVAKLQRRVLQKLPPEPGK